MTHFTISLSVTVVAGGTGSHGTSGPERWYPPEVSSPAPMRIVTPKFVEITFPLPAPLLRAIKVIGAIAMIAITPIRMSAWCFRFLYASAQTPATTRVVKTQRGCINVARAKNPPTAATRIQNLRSTGLS